MKRLLERLESLQPIVSTVRADDLYQQPEIVRNNYEFIASLFYPFESVKRELREPLLRRLKDSKPVVGYVSGDYGYGKTATMVWLWQQCEHEGMISVPPFLFYDWDAILKATAFWLTFRLKERRPDIAKRVTELLDRFRSKAIDELAEEYVRRERVPFERAKRIIDDLLKRGMLSLSDPSQVVEFLQEASSLAREGGFKGLIVFADEVQNFVDRENPHERVEQLRMFVHAFRTLSCPVGVFWGLASRVEERLHEQAGDMMQRVQEYRAFLQLHGAYSRDFPKQLWKHLCDTYAPEAYEIVDEAALEGLGQICERKDLSNGPRTVIAAFRCVASLWQERQNRYTVWELADDYENRRIVFEGAEQQITTTLRTLLSEPMVQGNPEYQKAIRFLCMFPEGVHIKVAERYRVRKAIEELADAWGFLGTHIYQPQHDYFALTSLSRRKEKVDALSELLRRFKNRWWHEYPEHSKMQTAKLAFILFVLPEIFPKRGSGDQGKWSGHLRSLNEAAEVAARKVTEIVLEGTFDGTMLSFPERKIAIGISDDEQALTRWRTSESDVDLTFRFLLLSQFEDIAGEIITVSGDPNLDFRLNMERHYDEYPSDLELFREIMLPQNVTAKVLLNLAMFVFGEMNRRSFTESERGLLETNLLRPAIRHAISLLFPETMKGIGVRPKGVGQTLIEQVFTQKCREIFPDYKPLLTTRQSTNDLQRYKTLLLQSKLTRAEKQGQKAVAWTQEELTKNLGVSASQRDAVVSRLSDLELLKVKDITTREGRRLEVGFTLHPLEQKLQEWVEEFGTETTVTFGRRKQRVVKEINYSELYQRARRWGAYKDEIDAALDLAQARGILERVDGKVRQMVAVEDPEFVRQESEKLRKLLEPLSQYFSVDTSRFEKQIDEVVALTYSENDGDHEEARRLLWELHASLKEFAVQKADQIIREANDLERKLRSLQTHLPTKDVEQRVELSLRIAEWLEDQRRQLQRRLQKVADELKKSADETTRIAQMAENFKQLEEMKGRLERLKSVAEQMQKTVKQANSVMQQVDSLRAYVDGFKQWMAIAKDANELRDKLPDRYADLREQFDDWQESVMEHFAENQQEALKDYERFRLDLDEIRRELAERQQGEKDAFTKLVENFEKQLKEIADHHLRTSYDPSDPKGSYDRLFNEVMERFNDTFIKLSDFVERDRSRITFLKVIRQQDVSELEREVSELDEQLKELTQALTIEVIKSFRGEDENERLPKLCDEIRQWISKRGEVQRKIQSLDKPQELDEFEKVLVGILRDVVSKQRVSSSVSLAQIWEAAIRNSKIPPEQLLSLVEQIYRKGWIEIAISERK
ncbi:MAG: hypothetical protein N3B10_13770 [Armatimonadetes bacterium]|nr:hypothetical protein [Armatimonadota bacterium]